MAKIHSKYKQLTVELTNGETFETRSTYPGAKITLEIDRQHHPAWQKNKSNFINTTAGKISKFNASYGKSINFTQISTKNNNQEG